VRSRLTPSHPLPSFPLPPAAHLWTHRIRTAPTKAILARAAAASSASASHTPSTTSNGALTPSAAQHPWRALPNPFNLSHSAMHVLAGFDALDSPEKEQEMAPFDEAYELLVLDAPSDSPYAPVDRYLQRPLAAFDNFLAATIARACGIKVPGVTVFNDDDDDDEAHLGADEALGAQSASSSLAAEGAAPTVNGNGNKKRSPNGTSSPSSSAGATTVPLAVAKKQEREQRGMDMPALVQAALEHGAVECFLRGDLVWDFGDVRGVTTGFGAASSSSSAAAAGSGSGAAGGGKKGQQQQQPYFGGIDLKKVGKDGIVAPPMPAPQGNGAAAGAGANGATGGAGKKGAAGKGGKAGSAAAAAAAGGAGAAVNGKAPATEKERKERVLDGLRDDKLARRLARSLFK